MLPALISSWLANSLTGCFWMCRAAVWACCGISRRFFWRLTPEALDEIVGLQAEILNHCAPLCRVGGTLVYSTCTLNRKENDKQTSAFLAQHPDFELQDEKTFFPDEGDQDGFYIAKMIRRR